MPAKKKSNVNRSGIYYLALECRQNQLAYSRMSIHDLIILLLPRWRSMTLVERKPYEDSAKQYKRTQMLNNEHVNTPVIPSSEEVSFIEKNSQENHFLDAYFADDLVDVFKRDLLFVTFQIFCRTDDEDGGVYYPAEMAILKYSFFEGVKQEYYTIIKPEKFPVGYTGTAIDLSRETHQIPPFEFIGANGDYRKIWQEVKRVMGASRVESSSPANPILIFCNAFERDQTIYLLSWLASKDEHSRKPLFRVCSFEAFVSAILRRLGLGDYAHQSVREQLRRPVYTLQVKDRCVYHDSLAIQYCCRAINHGFTLFLDGFVRERFLQALPKQTRREPIRPPSLSSESTPSLIDSISSIYLEKSKVRTRPLEQKRTNEPERVQLKAIGSNVFIQSTGSSSTPQQMSILSIENKRAKPAKVPSIAPFQIDCRWPIASLYTDEHTEDKNQYPTVGRGLRSTSTINSNYSDSSIIVSSVGRGRRTHLPPPISNPSV